MCQALSKTGIDSCGRRCVVRVWCTGGAARSARQLQCIVADVRPSNVRLVFARRTTSRKHFVIRNTLSAHHNPSPALLSTGIQRATQRVSRSRSNSQASNRPNIRPISKFQPYPLHFATVLQRRSHTGSCAMSPEDNPLGGLTHIANPKRQPSPSWRGRDCGERA
jgi:hypothetical protein